jgi:hypothetical protein
LKLEELETWAAEQEFGEDKVVEEVEESECGSEEEVSIYKYKYI